MFQHKTEDAYRAESAEAFRRERASLDACDTDGFVSQWCHDLTAREAWANADIVAAGGVAEFPGLFRRSDGARVAAKLIDGRFGLCWAFCDADGDFTGRFLPDSKGTPRSRMYREGFEVRQEMVPARAKVCGSGTGLSGLATCYVATVRLDRGFPDGAVVVR